ncbi:MAG: carboxypeptidase regulatory-like domain-containing protein [Elusimicrobiota bacterium]
MPIPRHCPACKNLVPPDAQACPHCPASFEDNSDIGKARSRRLSPLTKAVFSLAALTVLTMGAWNALNFALRYGQWSMDHGATEKRPGKIQKDFPLLAQIATGHFNTKKNYNGGDQAGRERLMFISANSKNVVGPWIFMGTVYDLESLMPVAGAVLSFTNARNGGIFRTTTDRNGRYHLNVLFPNKRGYSVRILKAGYARSYLDPTVENAPEISLERRRRISRDIAGSMIGPYALVGIPNWPLKTDFYLAPLK